MTLPSYSQFARLNELLFEGGGQFNHLIWQVQPTFSEDGLSDKLSSLHEWTHHELNNCTSYGLLLTYFAFLARHADADRQEFGRKLQQLVAACLVSHEVYATWHSVELMSGVFPMERLLETLPPDYVAYYRLGEGLVGEIESSFLRQQAFQTIVRSCFEAPAFAQIDVKRSDRFELASIRGRDLPDNRLRLISKRITPGLFTTWSQEYCDSVDDGAIQTALKRTRREDFFDLPLEESDAALAKFLLWLSQKWRAWLAEFGLGVNEYESHLNMVGILVDDMNSRCSTAAVAHPLRATSTPHDSAAILLQQMESEVVQLRPEPVAAQFIPLIALPQPVWSNLPVGQPPHLLIQARVFDDISRQHSLVPSDDLSELLRTPRRPVVFLRRRAKSDEGLRETASLLFMQQPEELRKLRLTTQGVPAFGLISSALQVDSVWWNEWLDPSVLWISKIDHSLSVFLEQHCRSQEDVRYSTATIREHDRVVHFLSFLTRTAGETRWGLYIGFCGEHTAKACVQFIKHKLDSNKFVFDREPFEGDLSQALSVVATHMMHDEFFFSFNQLSYS